MKNEFKVEGSMVTMAVQDRQVTFDSDDLPAVERFGQWKLWKGSSVYADFRDAGKMCKITLHKLLTGSKFVRWLNGNTFDFRRENIEAVEKGTRNRPCGVNLKGNEYRVEDGVLVIIIEHKGEKLEAYADLEDYPLLSQYTWNLNPATGYAQSRTRLGRLSSRTVTMHRLVMGEKDPDIHIDHKYGQKLDYRKNNLRVASRSQNYHNNHHTRDGELVGVTQTVDGTWKAHLMLNNFKHCKIFKTKDEAIAQRKQWEAEFNPTGLGDKATCATH